MTAVPPEAVTAAAEGIVNRHLVSAHWSNCDSEAHRAALMVDAMADATVALAAAAPLITAAERERIIRLAGSHAASLRARNFSPLDSVWALAVEDFAALIEGDSP